MNMWYKKSLLKTAIAALLLTFTSSESFSYTEYEFDSDMYYNNDSTDSKEEKSSNFYMSFNYNKANFGMDSFSAREDSPSMKIGKVFSLDSNGKLQEGYNSGYYFRI